MNARNSILLALCVILITSCTPKPKSEALIENHLELLKSGRTVEANKQYCGIEDPLLLKSVNSYKIINSQSKNNVETPRTSYTVKVETSQTSPRIKSDTVQIDIMKPEDFYAATVKSNNEFNEKMREALAPTGRSPVPLEPPKREEVSTNELCIFLPFEQFEIEKTENQKQIEQSTEELRQQTEDARKKRQSP